MSIHPVGKSCSDLVSSASSQWPSCEEAFCADLALLAPAFMLASSKWNKDLGMHDCMVRFAEVTDYGKAVQVAPGLTAFFMLH
jgi:hypothetical protein